MIQQVVRQTIEFSGVFFCRFPKLIHQTVINKHMLSCEEKHVIKSWKKLNPGYTHHLWDDKDIRQFMLQVNSDHKPVQE